ncbi:MAG TPA: Na-translocating system protein MpsC family protein [Solirubrobacteraceae bacterium]|nr:Na-translocating system protein MpsC family protein [Solirubrobacteraceae bacterium]
MVPRLSGEQLGEVTDAVVRVWARKHGHGPESGKSYQNDNLVFTVLHKAMTPQERTLLDTDDRRLIRQVRSAFEDALRDEYLATIGQIVGARVIDYHSQVLFSAELTVEVFVLEDG